MVSCASALNPNQDERLRNARTPDSTLHSSSIVWLQSSSDCNMALFPTHETVRMSFLSLTAVIVLKGVIWVSVLNAILVYVGMRGQQQSTCLIGKSLIISESCWWWIVTTMFNTIVQRTSFGQQEITIIQNQDYFIVSAIFHPTILLIPRAYCLPMRRSLHS